jgi:hypothetical protein
MEMRPTEDESGLNGLDQGNPFSDNQPNDLDFDQAMIRRSSFLSQRRIRPGRTRWLSFTREKRSYFCL